jgi:hypothetical protein
VEKLNQHIKMLTNTNASKQRTIESQQKTIATQQAMIAKLTGAKLQEPAAGGGAEAGGGNPCKKYKNCKKMVCHTESNLPELPANEHKRYPWWKLVYPEGKNPFY